MKPQSRSDDPISDKTNLVTGGAGFIGSHLVEALSHANDVRVFDGFSSGQRTWLSDDVRAFEGDVRDHELVAGAMADADLVLHGAAQVSVERSVKDPLASHAMNVRGTLHVFESTRDMTARMVPSSAAIYGEP